MKNQTNIAVIGDEDTILIFQTIGADLFPYTNPNKIKEVIKDLASKNYALILITEKQAKLVAELIETYSIHPYPIILPIPDGANPNDFGKECIIDNLKKVLPK